MNKELLGVENQVEESFRVDSLESANWTFKKIQYYNEQAKINNQLADREIARLNTWRAKENEGIGDSIGYFENLLESYYRELKVNNPKLKPISTPYGKISSRKQPDKWSYDDLSVMAWCKQNQLDCYIKVKEELNKADLKKQFKNGIDTATGEVIPGITIEQQDEKIVISVEE